MGSNSKQTRVYKQESKYNYDSFYVFKAVEKKLNIKNTSGLQNKAQDNKIKFCKFTAFNPDAPVGKSYTRKTLSKKFIFDSDEWINFLSHHASPFYDEEFPEQLVSIFGYFEIDKIKEIKQGKNKVNLQKQDKSSPITQISKIDERFQFLLDYSTYGFNWERPNLAEETFTPKDGVLGIRGSMWRSSSKDIKLKQEYSVIQNFEGEGGRVLQLLGEKGLPDWTEIRQGGLIDDWFIAATISVCRNPERIQKNILQPMMNTEEVLGFCFNSVGIWAILDVDESLAFYKRPSLTTDLSHSNTSVSDIKKINLDTLFLGAYSSKNNLWINYFEKAYAKLNEGYFNICNNGFAKHSLTDITSAPSRSFDIQADISSQNKLLDLLRYYQSKKYIMTAKSVDISKALNSYIYEAGGYLKKNPKGKNKFMIEELGLYPSYEYALFGVQTVQITVEGIGKVEEDFVELRCTHGPGYTWKGPCNYHSLGKNAPSKYNIPSSSEDNILIPLNEFMKVFETFSVCFYHDDYISTAIRTNELPYSFSSYKVTVKKAGEYYFRLCQLSHYMIHPQSNFTKIRYDTLTMLVSRQDETNNLVYLAGVCQRERDVWVKLNLEIGTYVVFVRNILLILIFINSQAKGNFDNINMNYLEIGRAHV